VDVITDAELAEMQPKRTGEAAKSVRN
jgi:hypothetical protein